MPAASHRQSVLKKRKPRIAGLPGQLPRLVTHFQGGTRATVRALCQTSAASIHLRLKQDFLLTLRYVNNTARHLLRLEFR